MHSKMKLDLCLSLSSNLVNKRMHAPNKAIKTTQSLNQWMWLIKFKSGFHTIMAYAKVIYM